MGLTAQVSRRWHDPRGSSLSTTYKQPVAARRLLKGRHIAISRAGLDVKPPGARRPQKSARGVRRDPRRSSLALKRVIGTTVYSCHNANKPCSSPRRGQRMEKASRFRPRLGPQDFRAGLHEDSHFQSRWEGRILENKRKFSSEGGVAHAYHALTALLAVHPRCRPPWTTG